MAVILAPTVQADMGSTTTTAKVVDFSSVVVATCLNGANTPPVEPCLVKLQLSTDNITFRTVDNRIFGLAGGIEYRQVFEMSNYANMAKWSHFRLNFGGNSGAAVTVGAEDSAGGAGLLVAAAPEDEANEKSAVKHPRSHAGHKE